jgi:hypothetical protein
LRFSTRSQQGYTQKAPLRVRHRVRTDEFVVDISTPNIDEIIQRVEPAGKIAKGHEILDRTVSQQYASKASEVRVHLDVHPELGWRADDAIRYPLGDCVFQLDSCLASTFLPISKEGILENQTVSVDQDSDKRLAIQKALHVSDVLLANQQLARREVGD